MKKNLRVCLILILVICNFSLPIFANNLTDLQTKRQETKNQLNEANENLEEVKNELSQTLIQIQELNEKIENYEEEVKNLDKEIEDLKNSILDLEEQLNMATLEFNTQKLLLDERLVTLYEAGDTSYLDVLLSSKNIAEFISNYYLVQEIATYDTELLDKIEKNKNSIESTKNAVEIKKKELDEKKDNEQKTAIILKNVKSLKDSYLSQLTNEEKEIQDKIDEYNSQIKAVESEITALMVANLDSTYIGGEMAWPVPGYTRITSSFGMRVHPITGVYKLHTGVDIGAPLGANFIAANDGVVIKAEYNGAYGNMVIVDHGGGIATLYAHGSEILVQLGQEIKKGDPILKVGSTGYSTGPHAHFEVRKNGEYVDPIPYITTTSKMEEN